MSKDKLIPELRFPEFANNGKWDNKPISKLGETVNGLSGKKGADFGSGRPYVQYKQVFDKSFIDFTECGKVDVGDDENQNQLQLGDILFTTSSETPDEVGFASVITKQPNEPTYLNSFCFILRPNDLDEINPDFSRYLFHSPIYRKSVSAIAQGSTRYNLSKGSFLKLRVPIPKPEEQQKIASCLSSLDELITAHNDKLDALKDHKKGLLQNLFPQEGETVPKVRFPEFEDDGEWVEDDIGTLFKFKQGVQVPVSNQFPEQGDDMVRFIRIIDITSNNEPPRYIQHPGDSHIISKDDLFMIRYGTPGLISIGFEGVIANNLFRLIWKSEKRNQPKFWFYAFQRLESFIYNLSSSSSMPAISFSTLEGLKIGFPPTIEEQQKIASCLSALDELITSQQEKIDQLQQHKKGMMQGLFPKIES